ncbi:MAG TPA: dihydroxyacetone kinase subunit DhaK, partial [Nitrososphaerales archaeon]|nr:dihydroxyacetone kinase subunit DhaK [Nitrososphaerales archaeon]
GDIMNFRIGEELATASGIEMSHVIVNDDIAIREPENRRGVAGTVLVHKIAGARAETRAALDDVRKIADRVISNVRTMGVALSSCINPSVGRPIFSIGENQMEIGIGIHGEAGVERTEIATADTIAEILYTRVSSDLGLKKGEEVFLLVNGMGGTPLMELLIVSRKVREMLNWDGISVFRATAGNYVTSLEMAGFSLSLLRVDEEMKQMLLAPQSTPAFPTIV